MDEDGGLNNPSVNNEVKSAQTSSSNEGTVPNQNTPQSNPSNIPPSTPEIPQKNKFIWVLPVVLIILGVIGVGLYYLYPQVLSVIPSKTTPQVEVQDGLPNTWINCSDIREVISEGGTLYFGCLGGVLIVNKNSGEVMGQISEANGLGNATVTSMVKKGDILYIGSQDGFTKFNLKDGTSKKISIKEGLVNAANIELHEDGDNLWVATFDGVSLYNEKTEKITNFVTELDPNGEKRDVNEILATNKAVYFIVLASAYSSGSVTRYDKATQTWEHYNSEAFGVTGQYARIDFYHLATFGGKVYVGDGRFYWSAEDKVGTSWTKIDGLVEGISKDQGEESTISELVGTDKSGLLFIGGYGFYRYVPSTNKIEVILKDKEKYANRSFFDLDNLGVGWFRTNKDDIWVEQINFADGSVKSLSLKSRPSSFSKLLALVDDEPLILADRSLWKYSLKKGYFEKLSAFEGFEDSASFYLPIFGTSKVFMFIQSCGQGCSAPNFYILDYDTLKTENLTFPKDMESLIQVEVFPGGKSSSQMFPVWQNPNEGLFVFNYEENKYILYNALLNTWEQISSLPDGGEKIGEIYGPTRCNQSYTFSENGNKFAASNKCSNIAESEGYTWAIKDATVVQKDKEKGVSTVLTPPVTEAEYSPFENFNKPSISKLVYADSKLWVLTNRGLSSYEPVGGTWKLYTINDGMLRNRVSDLLVGMKYLWVLNEWGGMSAILK